MMMEMTYCCTRLPGWVIKYHQQKAEGLILSARGHCRRRTVWCVLYGIVQGIVVLLFNVVVVVTVMVSSYNFKNTCTV